MVPRLLSPLAPLVLSLFVAGPAAARPEFEDDLVSWTGFVAQYDLKALGESWRGWRAWLDGQVRLRDDLDQQDLLFYRPGIGYEFAPGWTAHVGYAWLQGYPAAGGVATEHRPWQQVQWSGPVGDWRLISRSRLEQRFFEGVDGTGSRFRQMLRGTLPIPGQDRFYLAASDELFFDLDDSEAGQRTGIRQNRAYVGAGWFLDDSRRFALELGYLNQWLERPGEDRLNHAISLLMFINL